MADTKISALTAVGTPAATDEFAVNQSGTSKKMTLAQVNAYCEPMCNASVADQTGFASDTYLIGSSIAIPETRIQAKSTYNVRFDMVKTNAGTQTATMNVRWGTAASTADTSRLLFTFPSAQTAAIDTARVEINVNFRTVGSSTNAVIYGELVLWRTNTTTGFLSTSALQFTSIKVLASGFDSTVAASTIGVSINGGTSAAYTIRGVQATLLNIT